MADVMINPKRLFNSMTGREYNFKIKLDRVSL